MRVRPEELEHQVAEAVAAQQQEQPEELVGSAAEAAEAVQLLLSAAIAYGDLPAEQTRVHQRAAEQDY